MAVYLITAKHVIDGIKKRTIDQKVYLRINLKQGQTQLVETPIEHWIFHPQESNVDVAILNWAPPQDMFDYRTIPHSMAATQEIIQKQEIGVGDDVFLTGLFSNHFGSERNLPIIRVGNIAAMPEEKIHTQELGDIDAYLVEARSIGGLSGSPVFVYFGAFRNIGGQVIASSSRPLFYWLGLMHGHFDLPELEPDNMAEDSLTKLKINMGIAIVVPVWKVLEVMNQEKFVQTRKQLGESERLKKAATPDTTSPNASGQPS